MPRVYNISDPDDDSKSEKKAASGKKFIESLKSHWKIFPAVFIAGAVVASAAFGAVKLRERHEDTVVTHTWDTIRDVANSVSGNSSDVSGNSAGTSSVDPEAEVDRSQLYSSEPMDRTINWDGVLSASKNVECWIYIPGTVIDYPVMKPSKWADNQFYLNHDVYGHSSASGSIYMPADVSGFKGSDMHTIIIGHHMRNGSMFTGLIKYKDHEFYKASPYVYLYYPDRTEKWQIYSTYHTTQASDIYNMPFDAGTELYSNLLSEVESSREYDTAVTGPTADEPMLTLTTCDRTSTEGKDGRYVVNARLADTVKTVK